MFEVQHKDEFEMLEMYTDDRPLLRQRKFVMLVMKSISFACLCIIKHRIFETIVLSIILLNTVTLIMDDPTTTTLFEDFFLYAYTCEMCLKIVAMGFVFNKGAYLRDGWNFLDFIIVSTSLLPLVMGGD
jgi:hypothetical protein